jgi:hypothetical protein
VPADRRAPEDTHTKGRNPLTDFDRPMREHCAQGHKIRSQSMSIFDKVVAAVGQPASEQSRREARVKAQAAARPGDWLSLVLEHHLQIEKAFAAVKAATDLSTRRAAQKQLAVILTGHANAEESVLYPALARVNEKGHAGMGYSEQAAAKMQMAALEILNPMSPAYLDKLEQVRGAIAHHMFEEEGTWFLELRNKTSPADVGKLTQRFREEFDRYVGSDKTMAA